jgi:hypothetical protein
VRAAGTPALGAGVRTFVYVDGFNLYYQALKGTRHKWLDLLKLSQAVLPASATVERINYYTARVSGKRDPDMPRRQHDYFSALKTISCLRIHQGKFLVHDVKMRLSDPLYFEPALKVQPVPLPRYTNVIKTEEKGSDVSLGAHLVRDAFLGAFEQAAVITNDSDLVEPIRIVVEEVGLPVILLTPSSRPAKSLKGCVTEVRHISSATLSKCQFPNPVRSAKRAISKPASW